MRTLVHIILIVNVAVSLYSSCHNSYYMFIPGIQPYQLAYLSAKIVPALSIWHGEHLFLICQLLQFLPHLYPCI